jgi:hypothetical protein
VSPGAAAWEREPAALPTESPRGGGRRRRYGRRRGLDVTARRNLDQRGHCDWPPEGQRGESGPVCGMHGTRTIVREPGLSRLRMTGRRRGPEGAMRGGRVGRRPLQRHQRVADTCGQGVAPPRRGRLSLRVRRPRRHSARIAPRGQAQNATARSCSGWGRLSVNQATARAGGSSRPAPVGPRLASLGSLEVGAQRIGHDSLEGRPFGHREGLKPRTQRVGEVDRTLGPGREGSIWCSFAAPWERRPSPRHVHFPLRALTAGPSIRRSTLSAAAATQLGGGRCCARELRCLEPSDWPLLTDSDVGMSIVLTAQASPAWLGWCQYAAAG